MAMGVRIVLLIGVIIPCHVHADWGKIVFNYDD